MTSRQALTERIVERATTSPEFRADLIADPIPAIEREFGVVLPPDIHIDVVEEQPSRYSIVLPPAADPLRSATREPRLGCDHYKWM